MRRSFAPLCVLALICLPRGEAHSLSLFKSANTSGRLERPQAQIGVPSSLSYVERTITWPSATYNSLDFDYLVDSEESFDFLKVYVDGSLIGSWSGIGKSGHFSQPVTAGTHVVRFEYAKDGSVDRGLDTAWIDNVLAESSSHLVLEERFEARQSAVPSGWSTGGAGGGWARVPGPIRRLMRRPAAQAFVGYQSGPSTSSIQRQMQFTGTTNILSFDYLVDSEPGYDYLSVWVDGVQVWSISGSSSGHKRISVAPGSHLIRFQYLKDASVDVGRDTAQVDEIRIEADGAVGEVHDFDGVPRGTPPFGWYSNGDAPWIVADANPDVATIDTTTAHTIAVDGQIGATEYSGATRFAFADGITTIPLRGQLLVAADMNANALFISARVPASTTGLEVGTFSFVLDADRPSTLKNRHCGADGVRPADGDLKYVVTYSGTTVSTSQFQGSCQYTTWQPRSPLGSIQAAVSKPISDPGWLHLEARVSLPSAFLSTGMIGLGVIHQRSSGPGPRETMPQTEATKIDDLNVATWATLLAGAPYPPEGRLEGRIAGFRTNSLHPVP